jgi:hypothetical protein
MPIELAQDQEKTSEQHGYDPRLVPLGGVGSRNIHIDFCTCEDDYGLSDENRPVCGCGFGQCAKGLIF